MHSLKIVAVVPHGREIESNPCKHPGNWFPSSGLAPHATTLSWPFFGWQVTIDHGCFVWNISTIFTTAVHLPPYVPAKMPWFTEVLRHRNLALPSHLHQQNLSWTCIVYQQSHIRINTFICLHTRKHRWRRCVTVQLNRSNGKNFPEVFVDYLFIGFHRFIILPLT